MFIMHLFSLISHIVQMYGVMVVVHQWWRQKFSDEGAMFPDEGGGGLHFFSWLGTVGQIFVSFPRQMYKFSLIGGRGASTSRQGGCSHPPPLQLPFGATTVVHTLKNK